MASSSPTRSFPNLFVETLESTLSSIMVFTVADVRQLVRDKQQMTIRRDDTTRHVDDELQQPLNNNISDDDNNNNKLLSLPISAQDVIEFLDENKEMLKSQLRSNEFKTVEIMLARDFLTTHDIHLNHLTIHHFEDENANNECVYGISTYTDKKQVAVTFRGSITMQDWRVDAKLVSGDLANPLYNNNADNREEEQPEFVGCHRGFRDYLYGNDQDPLLPPVHKVMKKGLSIARRNDDETPNSNADNSSTSPKKRKIDLILDQIGDLLDKNPGYSLYITGHSLGGALALLLSLEAAVRFGTRTLPVTCVSIANPRVGDKRFRGAIQSLERQRKLRCLLVHNFLDLVPSMPNRLCRGDFCRPNHFCQPGMHLVLNNTSFSINYSKADSRWNQFEMEAQRIFITCLCWVRMAEQHNYRKYLDRLIAQKEALSRVYLNDLYKEEGIDYYSVTQSTKH